MGKEENAGYHHFLHLPHCFQKASCFVVVKLDNVVKSSPFPKQALVFMCLQYKSV